jgi:hypothetical protein
MYIPEAFRLDDRARAIEVMAAFDFALLVTAPDGKAQASHLPFLYDPDRGPEGTLLAHRWTLPRYRYDQLMAFGWKFLLPLSVVNLLVTAAGVLYFGA